MKLIMENWRRFLNEGAFDRDIDLGEVPLGMYRSDVQESQYTREQLKNNKLIYDTIVGYVRGDRQPNWRGEGALIDILDKRLYPGYLEWWGGKAYRGMIVSEEWMIKWFEGQFGPEMGRREFKKASKKHAFNLYKRFKGEITTSLKGVGMLYSPNQETLSGKRLSGGGHKGMESWSKSYDVAKAYATGIGGHYHQQVGFEMALQGQLAGSKRVTSCEIKVLSVILEAEPFDLSDLGVFLNLEPLYSTLKDLKPESSIKEVPALRSAMVTKIHIPYEDFLESYESATRCWGENEKSKVSPYITEGEE